MRGVCKMETTIQRLTKILEENPDSYSGCIGKKISRDSCFEDLGIDSLSRYELAYAAEDEFRISIPDEKVWEFVTLGNVIDYVDEQLKRR